MFKGRKVANLPGVKFCLLYSHQADSVDSSDIPFLYNGQFLVLAVLCSMPLLYFGGERCVVLNLFTRFFDTGWD